LPLLFINFIQNSFRIDSHWSKWIVSLFLSQGNHNRWWCRLHVDYILDYSRRWHTYWRLGIRKDFKSRNFHWLRQSILCCQVIFLFPFIRYKSDSRFGSRLECCHSSSCSNSLFNIVSILLFSFISFARGQFQALRPESPPKQVSIAWIN
jgi:hypothetical protein